MSVVICERCDRPIVTEDDPYCFIQNPYDSQDRRIVCEPCREGDWDRHNESLMENGPGPSLLDQQREAMKLK